MYDAAKGSWDRMDYFCEKYYPSSPYISCFNNPTRYIDESGDSAIVLLAPYGARNFGHLAIAIQNENGVWCLYSKNGTYEHFGIWGQEGVLLIQKNTMIEVRKQQQTLIAYSIILL